MRGIEEPLFEELVLDDAALALAAPADAFEASERPGAIADTSAAKPAVRAAAPRITQRRARLTRSSAASRIKTARDRSGPPRRWSCPMFEFTIGGDCQRSVRAI
jgi:hypothetical protein